MDYMTISRLSRSFSVSTRTLRYYEQLGLIKSIRIPGYSYRAYDPEGVRRLRQILLLRRLRIPLRQISEILSDPDGAYTIRTLEQALTQLDEENTARSVVRQALEELLARLHAHVGMEQALDGLTTLPPLPEPNLKEELTMEDLNRADTILNRFENVRLIYLPPATVAASHSLDPEPEDAAGEAINRFILTQRLFERKPDYRLFGFNNPNPTPENEFHGYEFWVTIPDDMEVPSPLVKKRMPGGLYAAHCIKMGDFEQWLPFWTWVHDNSVCTYDEREPAGMSGSLEEHLNAQGVFADVAPENARNVEFSQLDLLIPVKLKK